MHLVRGQGLRAVPQQVCTSWAALETHFSILLYPKWPREVGSLPLLPLAHRSATSRGTREKKRKPYHYFINPVTRMVLTVRWLVWPNYGLTGKYYINSQMGKRGLWRSAMPQFWTRHIGRYSTLCLTLAHHDKASTCSSLWVAVTIIISRPLGDSAGCWLGMVSPGGRYLIHRTIWQCGLLLPLDPSDANRKVSYRPG